MLGEKFKTLCHFFINDKSIMSDWLGAISDFI